TNIDGDALRNQINSEIGKLRDRFRVRVTPDVDSDTFAARLQEAARQVRGGDVEVEFNPRINQLKLRAEAAATAARINENIIFGGKLRRGMLRLQVKAAVAALNAMPHDLHFRAELDTGRMMAKLAAISFFVGRLEHKMSRWGRLTAAGALLIPPALAIVDNALRATGASLAVLVGYVGMAAVALTAVAVGGNNVVNAIVASSDDLDKYMGYLEQLTPAAQAFVEAVVNEKGAFKELQAIVQETMFHNLATEIRQMAKVTIPSFTIGLGGMGIALNGMAKDNFKTTTALSRMGDLDRMFGGMQLAMEPLVPIPGQILNALVKLSTAAMPVIIGMNTAFARWADTMTYRLNNAFADGTLQAGIKRAVDNIKGWFRDIANNPEFTAFMDRLKANGPRISEIFGRLAEAALKIINALAPVSAIMLTVADAFARLINAIPVELLSMIISKFVILKTALLIHGLVIGLTNAFMLLRGALVALGSTSAMVGLIERLM